MEIIGKGENRRVALKEISVDWEVEYRAQKFRWFYT
jgi:hypothetical protein